MKINHTSRRFKASILIILFSLLSFSSVFAQADELAQLALNIEKLSQFKKILQEMYDGYKVLSDGYNKVKGIATGNFKLHQIFLDGLYLVSPEIKKYKRIPDIIDCQIQISKECKSAFSQIKTSGLLPDGHLSYLDKVYNNLISGSLDNLEELLMIITPNELRMSDAERLNSIDRIYLEMKNRLKFLRQLNVDNQVMCLQIKKEESDNRNIESLYRPPK